MFSKKLIFGENAEVIYLTRIQGNVFTQQSVDSGLSTFIKRYARLLADMESTVSNYLVNVRLTSYPVAANDQVRESIAAFYNSIEMGKRSVITDNLILEAFRNVDIAAQNRKDGINDLLIARDKILSTFFREIGIKFQQEQKKAQLTEDEVQADEQLLLLNVKDMLEVQQEGVERVNRFFGLNISVSINPIYDRATYQVKKEVKQDGDTAADNQA
jgi:hypothetical protein